MFFNFILTQHYLANFPHCPVISFIGSKMIIHKPYHYSLGTTTHSHSVDNLAFYFLWKVTETRGDLFQPLVSTQANLYCFYIGKHIISTQANLYFFYIGKLAYIEITCAPFLLQCVTLQASPLPEALNYHCALSFLYLHSLLSTYFSLPGRAGFTIKLMKPKQTSVLLTCLRPFQGFGWEFSNVFLWSSVFVQCTSVKYSNGNIYIYSFSLTLRPLSLSTLTYLCHTSFMLGNFVRSLGSKLNRGHTNSGLVGCIYSEVITSKSSVGMASRNNMKVLSECIFQCLAPEIQCLKCLEPQTNLCKILPVFIYVNQKQKIKFSLKLSKTDVFFLLRTYSLMQYKIQLTYMFLL